ncbi:regulatory protein RecX [Altererythrobacter sp. MF3-039]|uniref:regulatory protein RecX n=1 Tax=Altererythrobacter sp. MF3-039 TaxID=3252901 RepID=UPI00390C56A4
MVSKETGYSRRRRKPKPLDAAKLEELALAYVARFSTSSAKLATYLQRKTRERGFEGADEEEADVRSLIAALVERYVELGYIDDAAYARSRGEGLRSRGYGARRVEQDLRAAGIDEDVRQDVAGSEFEERQSAYRLAERRRFGPFGAPLDRKIREKQIAAMVRAGHSFDAAKAMVDAADIDRAADWVAEAEGME